MELQELNQKIESLETEMETLMELAKELRDTNEKLSEENVDLETQVEELQGKLASFEIGSDPVEHQFTDEQIDLSQQINLETDWKKKSKLIQENLSSLVIEQGAR